MLESLHIIFFLSFFKELIHYETSQNERRSQSQTVLIYGQPEPQKELRRQPDAGRYPSVTDAMPQPDNCQ